MVIIKQNGSISRWFILGILTLVVLLVVINCFIRSGFQFSIDYNEGWNASYAQKVFNKAPLYSSDSPYIGNNYPPLSFYIISFLSETSNNILMVGRYISLISVVLLSLIVGYVVREKGEDNYAGIFSGIFCLGIFSIFANHYVGMNDPQLLGNLFGTLALVLYLINFKKYLFFITLLLAISIFIKHSLVIVPMVLFIDLLVKTSYKKLFRYVLFMCINIFFIIGIIFLLSEQYFLFQILNLETSRIFSLSRAIKNSFYEIGMLQIPIVISVLFLFWFQKERLNRTILIYIILSIVIGVYFTGGEGVDINVFFDLFISLSIGTGIVLNSIQLNINKGIIPQSFNWILPLLVSFGLLLVSPSRLIRPDLLKKYTEKESDFLKDIELLKSQGGLLMSENILLGYSSGKKFVYDAFFVSQLLKSGKLNEKKLIKDIELGKFSIIQLNKEISPIYKIDSTYGGLVFPIRFNGKFSAKFSKNTLKAIEKNYFLFHKSRNGFYYQYQKKN